MTTFVRGHYDVRPSIGRFEIQENRVSETIPDESFSIREILIRFAKGLPLKGGRVGEFVPEDDIYGGVNPATMDIVERDAVRIRAIEQLDKLRDKFKADADKKKTAKYNKKVEDEVARLIKERDEANRNLPKDKQLNND